MEFIKRIVKKLEHIIKFGCVGGLNTIVDFGIFAILNSIFGLNYIISQVISYSSGTLNSYIFNRFWTFKDTRNVKKKTKKEFVQFVVINAASLSISLIGMSVLMRDKNMNSLIAKIGAMGLAQVVNFLGYRFWVFGKLNRGVEELEVKRANN